MNVSADVYKFVSVYFDTLFARQSGWGGLEMSQALMTRRVGAVAATTVGLFLLAPSAHAALAAGSQPPSGTADDASSNARCSTRPAASLTFPFTFNGVTTHWESPQFTATQKSVCMDIAISASLNPGAGDSFDITLYQDVKHGFDPDKGTIQNVPRDNVARSYCWPGLRIGKTYYFTFGFYDPGPGGYFEHVDGHGQVRNP